MEILERHAGVRSVLSKKLSECPKGDAIRAMCGALGGTVVERRDKPDYLLVENGQRPRRHVGPLCAALGLQGTPGSAPSKPTTGAVERQRLQSSRRLRAELG